MPVTEFYFSQPQVYFDSSVSVFCSAKEAEKVNLFLFQAKYTLLSLLSYIIVLFVRQKIYCQVAICRILVNSLVKLPLLTLPFYLTVLFEEWEKLIYFFLTAKFTLLTLPP